MLHAKALHGNPYDGHTLGPVIADLEKMILACAVLAPRCAKNDARKHSSRPTNLTAAALPTHAPLWNVGNL